MIDFNSCKIINEYIEQGRLDLVKEHLEKAKEEYYLYDAKNTLEKMLRDHSGDIKVYQYYVVKGGRIKLLLCNGFVTFLMDPLSILPENRRDLGLIDLDNIGRTKSSAKYLEYKSKLYPAFKQWENRCTNEVWSVHQSEKNENVLEYSDGKSDRLMRFDKRLVEGTKRILYEDEIIDQRVGVDKDKDPGLLITSKRGKGLVLGIRNGKNNQ